jgi:hypothetical protein
LELLGPDLRFAEPSAASGSESDDAKIKAMTKVLLRFIDNPFCRFVESYGDLR